MPLPELEIHINLRHADLLDRDGNPDPKRVARLLTLLAEPATMHMVSGDDDERGGVLSPDGAVMAYWLFPTKAGDPGDDMEH